MHYTPLYTTRESFKKDDIDSQFLVNRKLLDITIRGIIAEKNNSIPQPRIIIGAEGAGKSWILMAIRDLLKEERKYFSPLYFDASNIMSLQELFFTTGPIEKANGRIVLLADNIDNLFSQLSEQDQYVLRGKLNSNNAPILICSATTIPKSLTDYSSAFFDGFDIQYIDRLSYEEVYSVLNINNDRQKQRAEELLYVTGTSIRNIMMVKNILSMSSSIVTDRQILFDLIYEPTLMRLNALPKISEKIVDCLAQSCTGKTLAQIRANIGIESSKLSPYITHLLFQKILSKDGESVRKSKYALADNKLRFFLSYLHE